MEFLLFDIGATQDYAVMPAKDIAVSSFICSGRKWQCPGLFS